MNKLVGAIRALFLEYTAHRRQLMPVYMLTNELLGEKAKQQLIHSEKHHLYKQASGVPALFS